MTDTGLRMGKVFYKPLFSNDYLEISIITESSVLIIAWKRQITFNERQTGYLLAFDAIKHHQTTNLIIDNEKIFLFTSQEKTWLASTFNDWISETNIRKVALVTSDLYKNLTDLGDFVTLVKSASLELSNVEHEFFTDHETALIWLEE